MRADDAHVLVVRDFLLAGVCRPCANVLRREPGLDALIANALTTRPRQYEPEPEPSRDERTFGTLGAAALLVVGFLLGLFWVWVSGWAFR